MKNRPDWKLWLKDPKDCKSWLDDYKRKKVLRPETLGPEDFLGKAEHNLAFSNWLMDKHREEIPKIFGQNENFYDWAIASFYYSVYHSALALVSRFRLSSKSHFATLCALIHYYYHRSKELTKEDIEFLGGRLEEGDVEAFMHAKALRERANYGVSRDFERMLADDAKESAERFLEKARKIARG